MLKVVCKLWIWQPGFGFYEARNMYSLTPAGLQRKVQADWKTLFLGVGALFQFLKGRRMYNKWVY